MRPSPSNDDERAIDRAVRKQQQAQRDLGDLTVGGQYRGQIVKIVDTGIFIRIKDKGTVPRPVDGFCHVSMCADDFIENIREDRWCPGGRAPKVGAWVKARVIHRDEKKHRVTLSLQSDAMREAEIAAVEKKHGGGDAVTSTASPLKRKRDASETAAGGKQQQSEPPLTAEERARRKKVKQDRRNQRRLAKKAAQK